MLMVRSCPISWLSTSWPLLLLLLLIISTTLISSIYGDPANMLINGNFEIETFVFQMFPQMDAIHDGLMDLIPHWQVVYGGVQILDTSEYIPDPYWAGNFAIHLNYMYGPGVIISSPLVTPRKGATYNLTFDIADNPDGGPLYKALRVKILVNNQEAEPIIDPYNVSAPENQRSSISWVRVGAIFVGTGQMTQIQFESMTEGSFGALIDNVQVTLMNLVDNGSFEDTKSLMVYTNVSWFNEITAPSDIMTSWTVVNGAIKRAGGNRWQLATDNTHYCLDMNADELAGAILSDPFPTVVGYPYVVLYDIAASPEDIFPVVGSIFACVKTSSDGAVLTSATEVVNADTYSRSNIGWQTYMMTFKAVTTSAVVEFVSRIQGSDGPLLDNVLAYQVVPTGKFKSVPLTYSRTAMPPRPTMWITILAGVCFLHNVFSIFTLEL